MQSTLEEAAHLVGTTVNQFILQAAYQEAQKIIEKENVIRLSEADAKMIFHLMENPPKANKKLQQAVKDYKKHVRE